MKLLHGVNVVSITVTDLARAREFYRDILGLGQPWFDDESLGWIEWGERGKSGNIAVTVARDGASPGGDTIPVLNTGDCHALHAELNRRGVRCEAPVGVPASYSICLAAGMRDTFRARSRYRNQVA